MEKLFGQEIDTEYGQGTKKDGSELEPGDGIAEKRDEKGLDVDEKSLSAEVGFIKKLILAGFESMDGVDTIGGLVRVDPDRDGFDVREADEESKSENQEERSKSQ